jgi:hypothetical protein
MATPIPLITTTVRTGHNPGDTFIGVGLQYLVERALGRQQWLLVDRFGRAGFKRHESLIRAAPFVVYGGMPQYNNYDDWMHWYDGHMWDDFILPWGLRVLTMAGGAGFRDPNASVEAFVSDCLRSKKTCRTVRKRVAGSLGFSVRDPYAHALLNALAIENVHLPCSATWATRFWNVEPARERPYLFLVPSTSSFVRDADGRRLHGSRAKARALAAQWTPVYDALKAEGHDVIVLCHEPDEYEAMRTSVPNDAVRFHGDAFTLLREYAYAHTVVSARLHASLPAFGIPGTKVLHLAVDVRGSAVDILPKIGRLRAANRMPEDVARTVRELVPSDESDLAPWEAAYVAFIREHVPSLSL